jgi:prevent-host-death family protein
MKEIASTEAKTHFGALLDMAQREPIAIHKKGRTVAVIMSAQDFEENQALKLALLQRDLRAGIEQADRGELVEGEEVFAKLRAKADARKRDP